MATLGGSFAGFLAVGIAMGDITLALINLGVIVALFCCSFVICSGGSGNAGSEDDVKPWQNEVSYSVSKRAGDIHVGGEISEEFKNMFYRFGASAEEEAIAMCKFGQAAKKFDEN